MAFPTINYKATSVEMDPNWQMLIEQKFTSFERYVGEETDTRCSVEFEKVAAQQSGDVHRVEVNLWLSGTMYRAEATADSFEKAIDEVRDQLDKELRRAHKKQNTLMRRGGRMLKRMLNRD